LSTIDDGSCGEERIEGCQYSLAINYDSRVNFNVQSMCVSAVLGCMDSTALNYLSTANVECTDLNLLTWGITACSTCDEEIQGCQESSSANYNSLANTPNASDPCVEYPTCTTEGCSVECCRPLCTAAQVFNSSLTGDCALNGAPTSPATPSEVIKVAYCDYKLGLDANDYGDAYCALPVRGCMDTFAFNYNSAATLPEEENTCQIPVSGCTDSTALNYYSVADVDGGTCYYPVPGCTITSALNFDSAATDDDGSCVLIVYGCTDSTAMNYDSAANTESAEFPCKYIVLGCVDSTALNYDSEANVDDPDNQCKYAIYGCTDSTAVNYNSFATDDSGLCVAPAITGCTEPESLNFDSLADSDDRTCIPIIRGCTTSGDLAYQAMYNVHNESECLGPEIFGCTDSIADTYQSNATSYLDGSCIFYVYGCTDSDASNHNEFANVDDGSCFYYVAVPGCTVNGAENYDANATEDDGTCTFCTYGCTDSAALNYQPAYTCDDGSCSFAVVGCGNPARPNFDSLVTASDDSLCEAYVEIIAGCTDSDKGYYNPFANFDNGECITWVYGCMNSYALNYNSNANLQSRGDCEYPRRGCTDSNSVTYDARSNVACDDFSIFSAEALPVVASRCGCYYIVEGCMETGALNYNSAANVKDTLSCTFPDPPVPGCADSRYETYDALATAHNQIYCDQSGSMDTSCEWYNSLASYDIGCFDVSGRRLEEERGGAAHGRRLAAGCMWPEALNYDSTADSHDFSVCQSPTYGCTDTSYTDYVSSATTMQDGGCVGVQLIDGCTNSRALNYNSAATVQTTCTYPTYGCTDSSYANYNADADTDDGSCSGVDGCTDTGSLCYS